MKLLVEEVYLRIKAERIRWSTIAISIGVTTLLLQLDLDWKQIRLLQVSSLLSTSPVFDSHNNNSTTNTSSQQPSSILVRPSPPYYQPLGNDKKNLWDDSPDIPNYLKEYFTWHARQRSLMNETNWDNGRFQYLVASSLVAKANTNGGTTDRLRSLPNMLKEAATQKRILLVFWNKPYALEHYLLPPNGGLDWRVPHYMVPHVSWQLPKNKKKKIRPGIIRGFPQYIINYGDHLYDDYNNNLNNNEEQQSGDNNLNLNNKPAAQVLRTLWNVVYTPSPPVAQLVYNRFVDNGLSVGEFATAHIRSVYAMAEPPDQRKTKSAVFNALNCVSQLRPQGPFYVAADHPVALDLVHEFAAQQQHSNVTFVHPPLLVGDNNNNNVTTTSTTNHTTIATMMLHTDLFNASHTWLQPQDWYDGFVDLYVMAQSNCVAHGKGGFGKWGLWLGYNSTCSIQHGGRGGTKCEWKKNDVPSSSSSSSTTTTTTTINTTTIDNSSSSSTHHQHQQQKLPIFLEPSPPADHPNTDLPRAWGPDHQ